MATESTCCPCAYVVSPPCGMGGGVALPSTGEPPNAGAPPSGVAKSGWPISAGALPRQLFKCVYGVENERG